MSLPQKDLQNLALDLLPYLGQKNDDETEKLAVFEKICRQYFEKRSCEFYTHVDFKVALERKQLSTNALVNRCKNLVQRLKSMEIPVYSSTAELLNLSPKN